MAWQKNDQTPAARVDPEFIDCVFRDIDGLIEVREISQDNGASRRLFFEKISELKDYVPPNDRHTYVGVFTRQNKKDGTASNCVTTVVLWCDYDNLTPQQVKRQVYEVGMPEPSILVDSGHGVHCYWLLDRRVGSEVVPVLKRLADITGGDTRATDKARIMRLPGTWNVKNSPAVKCEVSEINGEIYCFETLAAVLDVKTDRETTSNQKAFIPELHDSKFDCIRKIADGVKLGHRNFATGRIVGHLKLQGCSFMRTSEIIQLWNRNNEIAKGESELRSEMLRFWNGNYMYTGGKFSDQRLEYINQHYCNENCIHHRNGFSIINDENSATFDNEIFKSTVYPKIMALEIACYSFIVREGELTRERLSRLVNRHIKNKNFNAAVSYLKNRGMIDTLKPISGNGVPEKVILRTKSNYGRGYTLVPTLLTKLYSKKGMSDDAYKLAVLLKNYAYGKDEVYPTRETMALKLGIDERSISRLLKWFEDEGLIKRSYASLDAGKTKLIMRLQF